jgi:hypothetical protein
MKQSLILYAAFLVASTCNASSNVTFSGGGYEISVVLSDEDCTIVGLKVSGENPNIISITTSELAALSEAESDCKNKTIHLVLPATKTHPYFELKSNTKTGHMILGKKKTSVSADWLM